MMGQIEYVCFLSTALPSSKCNFNELQLDVYVSASGLYLNFSFF